MNLDGSRWSAREWITGISALSLSMLTYIYVYVLTLKINPNGFLNFLAAATTFLILNLLLRELIALKESIDRKK